MIRSAMVTVDSRWATHQDRDQLGHVRDGLTQGGLVDRVELEVASSSSSSRGLSQQSAPGDRDPLALAA